MKFSYGLAILEALLLSSPEPLPLRRIAQVMGLDEEAAQVLCEELGHEYEQMQRGIQLQAVAGGYQLVTRADLAPYVRQLHPQKESRLSQAQLETLAVIAYRQPVTRADIEQVRGVKVDHSLHMLLERGLIREIGRREGPGRPILYGTTKAFLLHFGLRDLTALPPLPAAETPALEEPGLFALPAPTEMAAAVDGRDSAEPQQPRTPATDNAAEPDSSQ